MSSYKLNSSLTFINIPIVKYDIDENAIFIKCSELSNNDTTSTYDLYYKNYLKDTTSVD
jgi:hypothetical protein